MPTNDSNDWVKEGTPREDWDRDTDYGVEINPAEWNDYSEEQAVPVPTPAAAKEYQRPAEPRPEETFVEEPRREAEEAWHGEDEPTAEYSDIEAHADPDAPRGDREPDIVADDTVSPMARDDEYAVGDPGDGYAGEERPVEDLQAPPPVDEPVDEPAEDPVLSDPWGGREPAAPEDTTPTDDVEETQVRQRPVVPPVDPSLSGEPHDEPHVAEQPTDERPLEEQVAAEEAHHQHDADADRPHSAVGTAAVAAAGAAGGAGLAGLYRRDREDREDQTQVIDQSRLQQEQAEEEARMARLREQRDARDARLGVVPGSDTDDTRVVTRPAKRQSDRFFGAFSLFVLRLVTAAIIGVLGYQVLQDVDAASDFLAGTVIPEPRLVAWILGFGLVSMAVLLVLGLGVRGVGFLLLFVSVASLVTIRWGAFSVFQDGMEGFLGDRTLLTAAVSLILMAFGAGRWSIDGAIRGARDSSRAARSH